MTVDVASVLAAALAAAAAFLAVAPERLTPADTHGVFAKFWPTWLQPVDGAPSAPTRLAVGVCCGCVLLTGLGRHPYAGWIASAAAVVVCLSLGRWSRTGRRSHEGAVTADVPIACLLIATCLDAGLPLRGAVTAAAAELDGPLGAALTRMDVAVRLGVPEPQAWEDLAAAEPALADLSLALRHVADTGVALAPTFRQLSHEASKVRNAQSQARARRAGISSVLPLMACHLPAFVLVGVVPIVGGVAGRLFGG